MLEWADVVVTVCGHADEQCPLLPPTVKKLHWLLTDPAQASGTEKEIMNVYREIRDVLKIRIHDLLIRLAEEVAL